VAYQQALLDSSAFKYQTAEFWNLLELREGARNPLALALPGFVGAIESKPAILFPKQESSRCRKNSLWLDTA
jgi:hypothetical protein